MQQTSASARAEARQDPGAGRVLAAAAASAALFSAPQLVAAVPEAGPLAAVAVLSAPFPLMLARIAGGSSAGAWGAAVAAAFVTLVAGPRAGLAFLLLFALPGLVMAETLSRGRGLRRGVGLAVALVTAQLGIVLLFAGPRLLAPALAELDRMAAPEFLEQMAHSGVPADQIRDWEDSFRLLRGALEVVYPAVVVILGAVFVLANAALLRAWLVRRDPGWLEGGEFERVRWPLGLVVVFVASGAALLAPELRTPAYNVLLVIGFLFALQGLAIVSYYARRLAGPPLLRAALVALVLLNPWAPQLMALLGLFDNWVDFRRFADPPAPSEG